MDAPDGLEEPEEPFNPDYASLPALRPAQPPQYKPTPNYPSDSESIITYVQCSYQCLLLASNLKSPHSTALSTAVVMLTLCSKAGSVVKHTFAPPLSPHLHYKESVCTKHQQKESP